MSDNTAPLIPVSVMELIFNGRRQIFVDITKYPDYAKWRDAAFKHQLQRWL